MINYELINCIHELSELIKGLLEAYHKVEAHTGDGDYLSAQLAECGRQALKAVECIDDGICICHTGRRGILLQGAGLDYQLPEDDLLTNVEINESQNLAFIELDCRIPSRSDMCNGRKSDNKEYSRMLDRVMQYVFKDYPNFYVPGKATLLIYSEYRKRSCSRDADNTYIKPIIDALCRVCRHDDNIEDLGLILDGAVTGRNHVTLVLAPALVFEERRADIYRRLQRGGAAYGQEES